jgi:DNA polymerase III epsilon subunit-like protein|tara:strand:+ start:2277 stop:3092 length:816 start_codon:yes stop_codon:yes gene_type:complete
MKTRLFFGYDFETSNLLRHGGKPIEVAAVLVDIKTGEEIAHFQQYMYLEPGEKMGEEALETHGKTKAWLKKNGVSRKKAFGRIWHWLKKNGVSITTKPEHAGQLIQVGQNIALFDSIFLKEWAKEAGYEKPFMNVFTRRYYDTMYVAQFINDVYIKAYGYGAHLFKVPETGHPSPSLEHQAIVLGEDVTKAHGALWDARTAMKCHLQHIATHADILTRADTNWTENKNIADPAATEGVYCPHCAAWMSSDTSFHQKYSCIMCANTFYIQEG